MRKTFLIGTSAIVLFAGALIALIGWATRDVPSVSSGGGSAVIAPVPVLPGRAPPPAPAAVGSRATVTESAQLAKEDNAASGTARGARAYRPNGTRRAPRGATNSLASGLGALQPRVAGCGSGATGDVAKGGARQALLVLDLEPQRGSLKIVGASVQQRGGASDSSLECARGVLVGQVLTVPEARPGQHVRVPYPLRF